MTDPTDRPDPYPAEQLPTHWGHWVRNGEHYWVYGKGPMFHIQRLNTETGLPHEDTADFAITLNSAEMRGHWRPAVPDDAADLALMQLYAMFDPPAVGLPGIKANISALRAERERLRERLEALADKWQSRSVQLAPRVDSIVGGPEWTAAKHTQIVCDEHAPTSCAPRWPSGPPNLKG
jgi:hypothetical protein